MTGTVGQVQVRGTQDDPEHQEGKSGPAKKRAGKPDKRKRSR